MRNIDILGILRELSCKIIKHVWVKTLVSLISLLYGPCNEGHRQGRFYNIDWILKYAHEK